MMDCSPRNGLTATALAVVLAAATQRAGSARETPALPGTGDITREALLDRIYGGWVGMLIGGLEGLPHEFKYREQPRETLPEFTFLEKGARSDDDNDFEWTHLWFMDKEGVIKLPYPRLVEIWKANMNAGIWVANKKARELMDQGVVPPATGSVAHNPHASYNLSGQFCTESYGLIAPGMPPVAADIGLHYAHIAVSAEPLQATQFWTSLVSLRAFREGGPAEALQSALAAVDPGSCMAEVVADAIRAFGAHPEDWKAARQELHAKWRVQRRWNDNSTPVNGAAVCLALLYGRDDFYRTLQLAMALGYDADCNAATAGTVVGVRLGFRRIAALPQFRMPDHYLNKTRPQLPAECTVSEQAGVLLRVAERVILANGGERITIDGQPGYRVRLQQPRLLEPLPEKVHTVKAEAVDYREETIYHSPETPGYTSWVGVWDMTDGRLCCDFRQLTGPRDNPVSSVPLLESTDGGATWRVVPRGASGAGTGSGGIYQMGEESGRGMEVLDGGRTLVRAVWPAGDLNESGYTLRSADGGRTWTDKLYPLPKDTWRVWPTLVRKLRDGRLVLFAGCWRRGEMTAGSTTPRLLRKVMFVSADQGRSWASPIELMSPEDGVCEESDFCELPSGDLFWVHRCELFPDHLTDLPPGAARMGGEPPVSYWYSDRKQSLVRRRGDTFVPEKPTAAPFAHSGYPLVLGTREGLILHLATDGVYWTADVGTTWQRLGVPGTAYYPKGLQLADGRILVIGHVGSDDVYGTVDQSIRQQTFRLRVTRQD